MVVKDRKHRAITIKLSEKEFERLKNVAEMYDMTLTDLIVRSLDVCISNETFSLTGEAKIKEPKICSTTFKVSEKDLERIKLASERYGVKMTHLIMRSLDSYIALREAFDKKHQTDLQSE